MVAEGVEAMINTQNWQDPWGLLNATADDLHSIGDEPDPDQLADLAELLDALRAVYIIRASGATDAMPGKTDGLAAHTTAVIEKSQRLIAALQICTLIGSKYGLMSIDGTPLEPGQSFSLLGNSRLVVEAPDATWLFEALRPALVSLMKGMATATASTVFVCEHCQKIGPAKQHNKRFCGAACRMRAHRADGRG